MRKDNGLFALDLKGCSWMITSCSEDKNPKHPGEILDKVPGFSLYYASILNRYFLKKLNKTNVKVGFMN